MEEYVKLLDDMEKDIHWHLFQCRRGAIDDVTKLKYDAVQKLKTVKKMLDILLQEIEMQIPHDSSLF
jgi:hypothetical protein